MEVFDLFSYEYGWTTEYILTRTLREISERMKRIVDRRNMENKFNATIHGMELKMPIKAESLPEMSKEKEAMMAEAIERAKSRKAKEYGSR